MKKPLTHYDAIVVGAGVIGLSLAIGLAKKNAWKVALLEKNNQPQKQQNEEGMDALVVNQNIRATAIGLPSIELLNDLDVWSLLDDSAKCCYDSMTVWDENSDGELNFNAHDFAVDELGYIVDHNALLQHLSTAANAEQLIDRFDGVELLNIEQSPSETKLTISNSLINNNIDINKNSQQSQLEFSANWIFAADGANSSVRALANITCSHHDYHQLGLVVKIKTELPHQSTAWQCFKTQGPIALLPLNNGECSIVWSLPTSIAHSMLELSDDELAQRIQLAIQSRLGKIVISSKRHVFPLKSLRAQHYVKDSFVLLGDSAHVIHPMSGQGANLGFGDVIALLNELSGLSADSTAVKRGLRRYERQQKLRNNLVDTFQTNLDRLFSADTPMISSLRGLGLKAVNNSSVIKSMFAKQVVGK